MLFIGLYFPTSFGSNISKPLFAAAFFLSVGLVVILILRTGCDVQIALYVSAPIVLWLVFCTLLSMVRLYKLNLGPLPIFALLAFSFSVKTSKLKCENLHWLLATASIVNVCLGVAMVGADWGADIMVGYYSNFYEELLPAMVEGLKPVTVFGSHSIAGMFAYLLFFLNFRTYQKTGKQ